MRVIVTESQLRKILNEQTTCKKGDCENGQGESIDSRGAFIGSFKEGAKWSGIQTGLAGDQVYIKGKPSTVREPEERTGGFMSLLYNYGGMAIVNFAVESLPVNAKSWVKDLAGIKSTITNKDFSTNDLIVLIEIVKRLKKEGRSIITPDDYELKGGHLPNKTDEKGQHKILGDLSNVKDSFNDTTKGALYRLRTTLGHARISTDNQGNTVVVDEFDFNNAVGENPKYKGAISRKERETLKGYETIKSILNNPTDLNYAKFRKLSTAFGSAPGKGAHVYINLGDEADIF